ncbi:hypothetical protein WR25_06449 isoform B [Diploscapter pachys]|uniref:BPTI/Kunitz inhibitor domain-containing protein n=1 Tax=Diploscapter pachys TaxID=2018661 RepID=A0A2A2K8Y0_9BILA|nr:hypothetical protein WR25_06449 isoform B [Diploscapter pachys]
MMIFRMLIILLGLFSLVYSQEQCFEARNPGDTNCNTPQAGQRFYFDKLTRRCQPFYYKGCNGGQNSFANQKDCMSACGGAKTTGDASLAVCASKAYAAGATTNEKVTCAKCPTGYTCESDKCCPTKEYTCKMQYDAGRFGTNGKHTPRYFYSTAYKNCMLFTFYGMAGNPNNFPDYNSCMKFCKP